MTKKHKTPWSEGDLAYLREHYPTAPMEEMERYLGRSSWAIKAMAVRHRIRRTAAWYGVYKRAMPVIEELYIRHGLPPSKIADALGLDAKALSMRIYDWGLTAERELYQDDLPRELAEVWRRGEPLGDD